MNATLSWMLPQLLHLTLQMTVWKALRYLRCFWATGASLMNGTTAPDLSSVSNVVRSDDAPLANAEASTISHPPLPIPTTLPQGANAVSSPSSSPSRPRHFLRNMRSRLLSRLRDRRSHAASRPSAGEQLPGHMPADTETNGPNSTPIVVDRGSVDEAEQLAALRANISQQLTRALARHAAERHAGSSTSTPFRSASPTSPETPGSVDPAGVPLPPDDSLSIYERPPSPVARAQGSPVTPRTPAILTGPSEPITPPPLNEQSFEAFLNDIQTDLRATLMRRHEQERRVRELRERMEHSSSSRPLSVPRIPAAPSLIPDLESRERTGPDRSSFTLPPNYHLTEHVPSVDTPLNWWRMFRFPPRTIQASPGVNLNPNNANPLSALRSLAAGQPSIPGPGPSSPATTHVPLTTSPFPVSPPITPGTTVPPSAPSESTTLTPVLIVGLRQQNTQIIDDDTDDEAPSDLPMYAPASPSSPFAPRSDFSTTSTSSLPPAPRASTSSDTTVRHPPRTSLFPHRRTSSDSYRELSEMIRNTPTSPPADLQSEVEATYGETWRQNLRAFLASALARGAIERAREERAARREERRLREAEAQQARESYVIWVIGGYYPENMLGAPNLLLGQFDHDDFWALAEFLGQVKPPVATREDIEKAGLEVIKKQQLAEYLKGDKIAPNTSDRCLICLSEYEDDEEVRIMSCKHGFHKDCVDKWMEVGRNNCPACRTKGVPTENTSTLANNSSPSAASSA
ncbi:uncharacterized protein EI90DRAFT_2489705 [Cantharellus anzutake]|uniref:uncharacterized protein n=1 Tax=Cantharellus anzutake TaxID=1750568 RepID=UPI0019085CD0|nr:uncharacterized protein EI90DRAFT_2489705 [Cantharellus anzutake]KAF8321994.1 hypothetical protein EI90DRAFT_2489705 [Cantharellus anzutake]